MAELLPFDIGLARNAWALPFRDSDGCIAGGPVEDASVDGDVLWSRMDLGV